MQRYWWPGFEMQLLAELQRQQNSAQFCDTLLQTEGISVPTHSCILSALSPYLSQKLSSSPSPPSGQKHQLQLTAVKPQTLLKLVGLLYSGELEVRGDVEQNDVLALARQLGIRYFVEGHKDDRGERAEVWEKRLGLGGCREIGFLAEESGRRDESRKMRDTQVHAEMAERRDTDAPAEKQSCISTGTHTVEAGEKLVGSASDLCRQATPPTPGPVAPNLDSSVVLQLQSITLDKQFRSTSCPVIPGVPSGTPSDGISPLNPSSGIVINPTSTPALPCDISSNENSNSPSHQEDGAYQQSPVCRDSSQVLAQDGTNLQNGKRNGEMADDRREAEQLSQLNAGEVPGEEGARSIDKRHAHAGVGMKSLAKMKQMQQMMETTQISIKVKLRRRTKGEVWEVVNLQGTDETLSVLTSLKQDGSNHKSPKTDLSKVPPPPSTVQPESYVLQPTSANSPKFPPHPNTSSDSQAPSSDCFTPNQNNVPGVSPLLQCQGSVEESDEQIEKLLEDIMMGLNILPNLERDCKRSHYVQPSREGGPAICQVPVTHKDAGHSPGRTVAGCVLYQDLGTPNCSSTNAGIRCCFTAPNQPSCSSLSSVLPDPALIQQQQECSSQYHSSVRSMWQRDGMGHQSTPLSKSQECVHPKAPTARSVVPSAFFSAGQKIHYPLPAFQELSSQASRHNLEFLPLTHGNESKSMSLSFPCMTDLRLPRCLSPLEPRTSSTKYLFALNNPMNLGDKIPQQPSLHGRPWLTENPGSLQSTITHRKNQSASLPQDTNCCSPSEQRQDHLELKPVNGGTLVESCTVKEVEEREAVFANQQNAPELKSKPRKIKDCDTTGEAIAPKRKKTKHSSHKQDAAGSLLAYKDVKVSNATKSQINLSICQVSLASNNVLAKEREMAASSSKTPSKFVGKPDELLLVTESKREKSRRPGENTNQTRIRTRGFLKKTQESLSDLSQKMCLVAKPVAPRAVKKLGVVGRKRGRPSKKKNLEELTPLNNKPAVVEMKSHNQESHLQMDNLPKEDLEKGDKTKQRCPKRRMNRSTEVEMVPLKKTINVERKPDDVDINGLSPDLRKLWIPKQPRTVILKEFQKLIKKRHSKTRKSKESHKTDTTERAAEKEGMAGRDCTFEGSTKEVDTDVAQHQDRSRSEESQVTYSVTVDKNHNQIFNGSADDKRKSQREDTGSSTSKEIRLLGGEDHPVFLFDALEEEVAKLEAEREQPLKNHDGRTSDTGVSKTTQQAANHNEGVYHSDLPQDQPTDHNLQPQTPGRAGPPLSVAGGISRTSGCKEEEDEEEEEVDILCFSPVKVQTTEDELHNVEIIPDEEEEEDANEIDVTGDEAE